MLRLKDEREFKAVFGFDPPPSSPICPTIGQTVFPNAVPEGHRGMTDLIDEAKKLRAELRQAEKAKRASEKYVTAVKWRYGQILAVIHVEAKKHKGDWNKALAEIGENRQRADEIIKIGLCFGSAEEAGKCPVSRALKLIRKGAKGSEANADDADNGHVAVTLLGADGEEAVVGAVGKSPWLFRGDNASGPRPNTIRTPPGICQFLHDLIAPHYPVKTILDPCAGDGALTLPWRNVNVIAYEKEKGTDFSKCPSSIHCDLVLCNPPFNSRNRKRKRFPPPRFLKRILEVVPPGTPIVLIVPMRFRLRPIHRVESLAMAPGQRPGDHQHYRLAA